MKISLITDGITPYVIGGMQRHSFYLAKYFAAAGIQVDLYHHAGESREDISKLQVFTDEERANIRSVVLRFPSGTGLPGHYLKGSYIYSVDIFHELMGREKADFIYAKGFTAWHLLKEKARGADVPPVGVNFHGYEMFQKPPSFRGKLEQYLLRSPVRYHIGQADYIFSYGGKITDIIRSLGAPASKIIEAPSGVERKMIRDVAEQPVERGRKRKFVFTGRYERRKGIPELHRAIQTIGERDDCEFHFIGPIPESRRLRMKNVMYHGTLGSREEIFHILDASDVLICPSHSEGMPNVILEGMARGLAVIATDVGAVRLMVSEENGWLLSAPDADLISASVREAMEIPAEKLNEKKLRSLNKIKDNFVWDQIASGLIESIRGKIRHAEDSLS